MKSPFSFCIVERGCLSLFALVFFHGIYMLFGSFERADFIECLSESSRKRTPRVRRGGPEGYGLYAECVEVGAKEFQGSLSQQWLLQKEYKSVAQEGELEFLFEEFRSDAFVA